MNQFYNYIHLIPCHIRIFLNPIMKLIKGKRHERRGVVVITTAQPHIS